MTQSRLARPKPKEEKRPKRWMWILGGLTAAVGTFIFVKTIR